MNARNLITRLGFLLNMVLLTTTLHSQIIIREGNSAPRDITKGDWYLDTLHHQAWNRKNGRWSELYDEVVTRITDCNGAVVVEAKEDTSLYSRSGRYMFPVTGYECLENISIIDFMDLHHFYFDSTFIGVSWGDTTETQFVINGITAFCATTVNPDSGWYILDARAWGVLDLNRKWLIEPIFDEPFHFDKGFAEVIYYGEKRKINEKGDFVE